MADRMIVFAAVFLIIPAGFAQPATGNPPKRAVSPTMSEVSGRLDLATTELDRLTGLAQRGASPTEIRKGLGRSTQRFSRFHVELGRLYRNKKEARSFISGLSDDLQQHLERLERVEESVHSGERVALDEAMNHVRSALEMVEGAGRQQKRGLAVQFEEVRPEPSGPPETKFTNEGPKRFNSRKQ